MVKDQLQDDLKAAMLARETEKVEVLKGLKSAILYAEVAANKRDEGLSNDEVLAVMKKESKKRQDSIELYEKGGNQEMAQKEKNEKDIIDNYLPKQLSEDEVNSMIDDTMQSMGIDKPERSDMGKIIGAVKSKAGASVEGSLLAKLVNARIQ